MRRSSRALRLALTSALYVGCSPAEAGVILTIRTDLVGGREFSRMQIDVGTVSDSAYRVDVEVRAPLPADYRLMIPLEEGPTTVAVSLLARDGVSRFTSQQDVVVAGATPVEFVFERSCLDITCPPADAPERVSCFNGACEVLECGADSPSSCEVAPCTDDSECMSAGDCLVAECVQGRCLFVDDARCHDSDTSCEPDAGCVMEPSDDA